MLVMPGASGSGVYDAGGHLFSIITKHDRNFVGLGYGPKSVETLKFVKRAISEFKDATRRKN
jgi:hypothetical protein